MVLGGHKDDRLVLGLHHVSQQVEQHGRFVVPADVEESQLQGEGRAQPFWGPTLLGSPHSTLPAPHPEHKARLKLTLSCSLSLDSTSRRISVGSVRPAGHGHTEDAGGVGTRCWDSPQLPPSLGHPLGPASTRFGFSSPGPVSSTAEGLGHIPIPDSSQGH